MRLFIKISLTLALVLGALAPTLHPTPTLALINSSASFVLRQPDFTAGGGSSSSSSFKLFDELCLFCKTQTSTSFKTAVGTVQIITGASTAPPPVSVAPGRGFSGHRTYLHFAYCGDAHVNQPSEQCDDGNNRPGDGCDSTCQIEGAHFAPEGAVAKPAPEYFNLFYSYLTSADYKEKYLGPAELGGFDVLPTHSAFQLDNNTNNKVIHTPTTNQDNFITTATKVPEEILLATSNTIPNIQVASISPESPTSFAIPSPTPPEPVIKQISQIVKPILQTELALQTNFVLPNLTAVLQTPLAKKLQTQEINLTNKPVPSVPPVPTLTPARPAVQLTQSSPEKPHIITPPKHQTPPQSKSTNQPKHLVQENINNIAPTNHLTDNTNIQIDSTQISGIDQYASSTIQVQVIETDKDSMHIIKMEYMPSEEHLAPEQINTESTNLVQENTTHIMHTTKSRTASILYTLAIFTLITLLMLIIFLIFTNKKQK